MEGNCALCQQRKPLRKSHYLPAALYRLVKGLDGGGLAPIHVSRKSSVATSKEIWAYLLCSECEQRFHKYGENYVLKNCYRGPADFPLQTALVQSGPPIVLPKARVYRTQNVSGIEIDKLVYFASSMFWRASAHLWKDGEGVLDTPSLGPYEEDFRRYLLGLSAFPAAAVMLVNVSSRQKPLINMITPPHGCRVGQFHICRFNIPGITFHLYTGQRIPKEFYFDCTHHSTEQFVGFMDDDELFVKPMLRLLTTSKPVGKLVHWSPPRRD